MHSFAKSVARNCAVSALPQRPMFIAQSPAQQGCCDGIAAAATAKPLRSPDVMYVPTPPEVVDAMLNVATCGKGDVLYDLGSGDGRIPIIAVQKYDVTRATGIEINPDRIEEAQRQFNGGGTWRPRALSQRRSVRG